MDMINLKDGLVRLKENENIFYDSVNGVYKYRMHCPECGKVIDYCRCYNDLHILYADIDEGIADYTCSARCCLLCGDWDEIEDALMDVEFNKNTKLSNLSETQAQTILDYLTDGVDFDAPSGYECEI